MPTIIISLYDFEKSGADHVWLSFVFEQAEIKSRHRAPLIIE